jgi:hypothetical protein
MIYRATTCKTPTTRRIDWEGRRKDSSDRWKLPFRLNLNIPLLLKIRDIGFIVLAAAVAAAAVLIVTVAFALPLLCPDGAGSDRCSGTDGEIMVAELPPAPAVQVPAQAASMAPPFAPPSRSLDTAPSQDERASVAGVPQGAVESPQGAPNKNLLQFRPSLVPQIHIVKTIAIRAETAPAAMPLQSPASEEATAVPQAMIAPAPEPAHKRPTSTASEKRSASLPSEGTRSTKAAAGAMTVGGSGVTVRSGPSRSRSSLFTLSAGEKVAVLKTEKRWLRIKDSKGRMGWAYSRYLR